MNHRSFSFSIPFPSGVVGSGLAVLSRYPIVAAFFHAWSVNGYIHRIQHGDWFGGKGVGMAKISVNDQLVHVYVAHVSTMGNAALRGCINHEPGNRDNRFRICKGCL